MGEFTHTFANKQNGNTKILQNIHTTSNEIYAIAFLYLFS